jgi:hypothetical protein
MEGPPPVAVANELSSYDEVLGLPHPPTGSLGEDEDFALQTKVRVRDGGPS